MRLDEFEQETIKTTFKEVFDDGDIYLFGSRVDDSKKGGDIDLYIKTTQENLQRKKIEFLVELKRKIGEQKIDIVFAHTPPKAIDEIALKKGILL